MEHEAIFAGGEPAGSGKSGCSWGEARHPPSGRAILHHRAGGATFGLLWLLEELDREFELKVCLDSEPMQLVDELGTVYQHPAIACLYLAVRYGAGSVGVRPDEVGYSGYVDALLRMNPDADGYPAMDGVAGGDETALRPWVMSNLAWLEWALAAGEYISCGRFTAADISVGNCLLAASSLGIEIPGGSRTYAYWIRLRKRGAYKRAQKREFLAFLRDRLGLAGVESAVPYPGRLAGV